MFNRIICTISIVTLMGGIAFAKDLTSVAKVGDHVVIELNGDAALKYLRLIGRPVANATGDCLSVSIIAEICDLTETGIRIEHNVEMVVASTRYRSTLTGTLPAKNIRAEVIPVGTLISASPGSPSTATKSETREFRLRLSDFEKFTQFKLQRWQLLDEIID